MFFNTIFFKQTTLDEKSEEFMLLPFLYVYPCSERVEVKYYFFIIVFCLRQDYMIL